MNLEVKRLNRILSYLLNEMKVMDDADRDLPMKWSIMHMYSSTQLATLMALKTGLNPEIAGLIACLHDIGAVMTKKSENHAENAEPFVREIIKKYNDELRYNLDIINNDEIELIVDAIKSHSDKATITDKPYVELMKNVDSLDRYLHGIKTTKSHLDRLKNSFDLCDITDIL